MSRTDLRERWRVEVWRSPAVTDSVRVLLVLLAEHMCADGYVSVPRKALAERLGRTPRRITERLELAVSAGLLTRVESGKPGRTATYRALMPEVRTGAPSKGADGRTSVGVRIAATIGVRTGAPLAERAHGADGGPAIGNAQRGLTRLAAVPSYTSGEDEDRQRRPARAAAGGGDRRG